MDIRVENENWNHLGKNVCQEFQVQRIAPARLQCHETAQHFYCTVNSGLFGQGVGGRRRIIAGAKMEKAKEKREAYVAVTNTPKPHEFKTEDFFISFTTWRFQSAWGSALHLPLSPPPEC